MQVSSNPPGKGHHPLRRRYQVWHEDGAQPGRGGSLNPRRGVFARPGELVRIAVPGHGGPLDGTTNYARGVPHFAVTIACADGAGVLAGATYDPLRDELYEAERGGRFVALYLPGTPKRMRLEQSRFKVLQADAVDAALRRVSSEDPPAPVEAPAEATAEPTAPVQLELDFNPDKDV